MFTHMVVWGTLWVLVELFSTSASATLEDMWSDRAGRALKDSDSLKELLAASDVSGPNAPIWTECETAGGGPGTLAKRAEVDVSLAELGLIKKNAERAFLAYCPERVILDLKRSGEFVTNENLRLEAEGGGTREEFFIIPQNSVRITKAYYPKMWATSAFGITGIGVVVLVDEEAKEIVVAVRGTVGIMNWVTDAAIIIIPVRSMCPNCLVHSGFWIATREIYKTVSDEVKRLQTLHPDFTLTITGHSLGGAVAYLLRLRFAMDCPGLRIELVTFGQPKTGNQDLARYAEPLPGNFLRVTHSDDLVVSLPPSFGWGVFGIGQHYVHTRNEYHIRPNPRCTTVHMWSTTDVKKITSQEWFYEGGAHRTGRWGVPIPTTWSPIASHSLYLYRSNICNKRPPRPEAAPTELLSRVNLPDFGQRMTDLGINTGLHPHGRGIVGDPFQEWRALMLRFGPGMDAVDPEANLEDDVD